MNFDYCIPTKILFGAGKLNQLAEEPLPGKKGLIVISNGTSMRKFGYLGRLEGLLEKQGIGSIVYDKILPNPIKEHVMEGAAIAKENGCDFVIGLGGGSSIDAAKAIAVMAVNPGDYWDYIGSGSGKGQTLQNGALPIVAITTTAGTGTEADPWTVITNGDEKIGFGDPSCTFPVLSVVDPELMLSVPPQLTAFQGFDALFHSVEGYIANIATPMSDLYALESIRLIAEYLPRAVADGSDIEARTQVALANTLAGMVESTSCCISEHSLEHAMSGMHPELPHGAGLIMLSEAYFSHFAEVCNERYAAMAKVMGGTNFVEELLKLQKACGVDELKMSNYGITAEELPAIAANARDTMGFLFELDPAELSTENTQVILDRAFG
ncbi:MAG: iron-containing alcohol dehydrogenase [Verrucomicrobia bacterium]|jgi:alcohol dehydrogenase|nr:iron-containing alcohol dehydrogenase [Verrucomicrobiota bacterium]MBT7067966.1 iron-containing alcohol dehydrogenase [Verrucomicrobiota bacterium]MBT7702461.1 iron-containing alcohol dehydrogenase [Verrucomicrobiota bacterium]